MDGGGGILGRIMISGRVNGGDPFGEGGKVGIARGSRWVGALPEIAALETGQNELLGINHDGDGSRGRGEGEVSSDGGGLVSIV